ncbi:CMP-N-acetylneuraminate-beta-galactosamide-alpha-2,3-sialyltransferase 1-like [Tachysurus ichikawai]
MAQVVHPDQTCGVPGRMCGMNLALIRDTLAWAEQRQVPLALLSLDQEKAFARVSHTFLFALLEQMGFGPGFVAMVRLLYTEPLAEWLRSEPTFQGLHVPGAAGIRAKKSVYADDATLFRGRDEDFVAVGHVLEDFSEGKRQPRKVRGPVCRGVGWEIRCPGGVLTVPGWPQGFGCCLLERGPRPKELGHRPAQVAGQGRQLGQEGPLPYRKDRLCFADGDPLEGDLAVVNRPPVVLPEGGRVHSRPALVSGGRHCAGPPEIVSLLEGLLDSTVKVKEMVEHALWSCPVAARFWRRVSERWSAEGGADINRDLMLYSSELKRMGPEMARPLWQAISVAKCVLWGARCECIRSLTPRVRRTACSAFSGSGSGREFKNLEPLVEQLRREVDFRGLHIPGSHGVAAKVSVYADDMTLFIGRDEDF